MTEYLLLFGAGLVAGTLNVIAGGGSFLTLPILMFLGLPPGVANGTNRVGILVQNVGAVWSFHGHRVLTWRALAWAAAPAIPGAALGTWLALMVSDQAFKRILAVLMVTLSLWTLWSRRQPDARETIELMAAQRYWLPIAFFGVGIYGGFIQAGVGFLILAVLTAAGFDLVRGNAIKVLTVLCFTALSLSIFAINGKVDWSIGLVLAAGMLMGGLVGARLTVLKGQRWIRGVVTVTMIVFAIKLWLSD